MNLQLVNFEIAKLLKEKGFDIPCNYNFDINTEKQGFHVICMNWNMGTESETSMYYQKINKPTQALVRKWLRDVHEINCYPKVTGYNMYESIVVGYGVIDIFKTYEEAEEAAIDYALKNLI